MPSTDPARVLIVGAGAVGLALAARLAPVFPALQVLARGEGARALAEGGLASGRAGEPLRRQRVAVIEAPDPARRPDLVVLATKTRDLAEVGARVAAAWGPGVRVMGVQNGLAAAEALRLRFEAPLHAVVTFNAWREGPGVVRVERWGALVLGGEDMAAARAWAARLSAGLPCVAEPRIGDAAWCKALINLSNSLTALAGLGAREVDRARLVPLLQPVIAEGLATLEAAGVREVPLPGLPRWWLLKLGQRLPGWLYRPIAARQLRKMAMSSMGQDLVAGVSETELEHINGAFLALAAARGLPVPALAALTALARARFAEPGFTGMPMEALEAHLTARNSPVQLKSSPSPAPAPSKEP